jgi:hypothetical protein
MVLLLLGGCAEVADFTRERVPQRSVVVDSSTFIELVSDGARRVAENPPAIWSAR